MESFDTLGDKEYVHTITGFGRFRITLIKQRFGWEATIRLITLEIPRFAATGMPTPCANLVKWNQGIILITGPSGSGKTTNLSTLVEMINQRRYEHIITLEDPIEVLYEPELCQISQREIVTHTSSQEVALRAALREDPDVIVIGELKNIATTQLAIMAAETGHLVLATMNTVNAVQTVSKLIESFPTEEQQIIRNLVSESLRGIICQQLIPKKDGTGMVCAYEVLFNNSSVANLIRKGSFYQIENVMITGKSSDMSLMSNSLMNLAANGIISQEEAKQRIEQIDSLKLG
jgi:twitching motility protein PilT